MRWPLYPAEVVASMFALAMIVVAMRHKIAGWPELPIVIPWLVLKLAFSAWLCYQVWQAGWTDIPLRGSNAFLSNVIMFVGPVSVAALLAVRILRSRRA